MKNIVNNISFAIHQLWYILDSKQKRAGIGVFFAIMLNAFLSMVSVTIVIPIIYLVIEPEALIKNKFIGILISILHINNHKALVVCIGLGAILVFVIKTISTLFCQFIIIKFSGRVQMELAIKMLSSYMKRPYSFFVKNNSAEMIRGVGNDVNGVYILLDSLLQIITNIVTSFMLFCLLLYTDFAFAIGTIGVALGCMLTLYVLLKSRMKRAGKKFLDSKTEIGKHAYQAITGVKEISVMQRREKFLQKFSEAQKKSYACDVEYCFLSVIPNNIYELILIIVLISMVFFQIFLSNNLSSLVAKLGTMAMSAMKILPSLSKISSYTNTIVFYKPSLDSVYKNIKNAKEFEKETLEFIDVKKEKTVKKLESEILLDNVTFRYNENEKCILNHVSLKIEKGDSVAFIGESGSGKTTLADIILGIYRPQEGSVRTDGVDIFTIPKAWSRIVGYVPQNVFLLDDTIKNNIVFGADEVDEKKIWKALEKAQLSEFIKSLTEGIETVVGERGVRFSGGQRQRIAIARALYYDPDVLVFDEATAALDNETEKALMDSINCLRGEKTLIIIAHRLETIRECNKIYQVNEGHIVSIDHHELFGRNDS